MLSRRIVLAALGATALVGLLFGGVAGVLSGGGDGGGSTAAAAPSGASASPSPSASASASPGASTSSSTSASPSASESASKSPSASPSEPPVPTGRTYHVTAGGKALDVAGGKKDANTPVILFTPKPAQQNQQWTLRDAGKGLVTLVARNSGKCLDIRAGKAVQDNCGGAAQQWRIQESGGGFVLVSRDGKQALGAGGKEDGNQGLRLVAVKSGLVWSFRALG